MTSRTPAPTLERCPKCQSLGWFWANYVERVPGRRRKVVMRWDPASAQYVKKYVECDTMRERAGRLKQTCECENGRQYQQKKASGG